MTEEEKLNEFRFALFELVDNYAGAGEKMQLFMVAGCMLSHAINLYVTTLGSSSAINLLISAIESVENEDHKNKLH
jgi:hypothetical protein|tara:strand:- start:263 stop:490 length:228 start_codon:yes stop_codon:yes gene_type:complete